MRRLSDGESSLTVNFSAIEVERGFKTACVCLYAGDR